MNAVTVVIEKCPRSAPCGLETGTPRGPPGIASFSLALEQIAVSLAEILIKSSACGSHGVCRNRSLRVGIVLSLGGYSRPKKPWEWRRA